MNYKYFDNASTTRVNYEVLKAYNEATELFYNPSALYLPSSKIKLDIEDCRNEFLRYFNAKPKSKFLFTSCATESNNAVLRSCIRRKDKKYLVSAGEHSSIYNTAKAMINEGFNIDFVPILENGKVDCETLFSMVDEKTDFVSIIHVSNETGAVNDIKSITKKLKQINPKILVHSDGVQAVHKFDIDLTDLGVDFYTISAHKINGVRGIAGLYIAGNINFTPYIWGGAQELGLRGGTENYAGIKAFTCALKLPNINYEYMQKLKDRFLSLIEVPHKVVSPQDAVPNIISIAFNGVRGETLVHILEDKGFLIGTGSACNSKDTINRVLQAMGIDRNYALGNIRISFETDCTIEDVEDLAKNINLAVKDYLNKIVKR